jgi:flagellar motor switch protein FliM
VSDAAVLNAARPASLLRACDDAPAFPGLSRIGDRMVRGFRDLFGDAAIDFELLPATITSFATWRGEQAISAVLCRYRLHPVKGAMLVSFPCALVARMVDIFYGGTGETGAVRSEMTGAELRYVSRIAEQCTSMLSACWADVIEVNAQMMAIETDIANVALVADNDGIVVQSFAVRGGGMKDVTLSCVYPIAALRPIAALTQAAHAPADTIIDPVWRDRLSGAVMQVSLPMRTIFARPELPLSQLLALKPGDFIPVNLPSQLPITVAGRLFAHGTVGESNGLTAIKIETIEQGSIFP